MEDKALGQVLLAAEQDPANAGVDQAIPVHRSNLSPTYPQVAKTPPTKKLHGVLTEA